MTEAASLPDGGLSCHVENAGARAVVRLRGDLDLDTVWTLGEQLSRLIRSGQQHLVLDLSECGAVSPVCVGVLNRTVSELKLVRGTLSLRGAGQAVLTRLRAAGLHPAISRSGEQVCSPAVSILPKTVRGQSPR